MADAAAVYQAWWDAGRAPELMYFIFNYRNSAEIFRGQSVCLAVPQTVSPVTSWQQDLVYAIVYGHTEPRVAFSETYKIIIPRLSLWITFH